MSSFVEALLWLCSGSNGVLLQRDTVLNAVDLAVSPREERPRAAEEMMDLQPKFLSEPGLYPPSPFEPRSNCSITKFAGRCQASASLSDLGSPSFNAE